LLALLNGNAAFEDNLAFLGPIATGIGGYKVIIDVAGVVLKWFCGKEIFMRLQDFPCEL
jgi:hypothetical protein